MKIIAYLFGLAGIMALAAVPVGRIQGHPEFFMGAMLTSWMTLSASLTLLGILAAVLAEKKQP